MVVHCSGNLLNWSSYTFDSAIHFESHIYAAQVDYHAYEKLLKQNIQFVVIL